MERGGCVMAVATVCPPSACPLLVVAPMTYGRDACVSATDGGQVACLTLRRHFRVFLLSRFDVVTTPAIQIDSRSVARSCLESSCQDSSPQLLFYAPKASRRNRANAHPFKRENVNILKCATSVVTRLCARIFRHFRHSCIPFQLLLIVPIKRFLQTL